MLAMVIVNLLNPIKLYIYIKNYISFISFVEFFIQL